MGRRVRERGGERREASGSERRCGGVAACVRVPRAPPRSRSPLPPSRTHPGPGRPGWPGWRTAGWGPWGRALSLAGEAKGGAGGEKRKWRTAVAEPPALAHARLLATVRRKTCRPKKKTGRPSTRRPRPPRPRPRPSPPSPPPGASPYPPPPPFPRLPPARHTRVACHLEKTDTKKTGQPPAKRWPLKATTGRPGEWPVAGRAAGGHRKETATSYSPPWRRGRGGRARAPAPGEASSPSSPVPIDGAAGFSFSLLFFSHALPRPPPTGPWTMPSPTALTWCLGPRPPHPTWNNCGVRRTW